MFLGDKLINSNKEKASGTLSPWWDAFSVGRFLCGVTFSVVLASFIGVSYSTYATPCKLGVKQKTTPEHVQKNNKNNNKYCIDGVGEKNKVYTNLF